MKKLLAVTGVLLATIATIIAVPVMAHAISMTFEGYESTGYGFGRIVDGQSQSAGTGVFGTVLRDDNGQPLNGGEWFSALCVEPGMPISQGDTLWEAVKPGDFHNGAGLKAAWLFHSYYNETTSNVELAGLQLAFWEVVKDSSYNLSAGNFQVTSGNETAIDYANSYLSALKNSFDSADLDRLNREYTVFTGEGKQDLIVKTGAPVPEASTILLFAIGLFGLINIHRTRFKK